MKYLYLLLAIVCLASCGKESMVDTQLADTCVTCDVDEPTLLVSVKDKCADPLSCENDYAPVIGAEISLFLAGATAENPEHVGYTDKEGSMKMPINGGTYLLSVRCDLGTITREIEVADGKSKIAQFTF